LNSAYLTEYFHNRFKKSPEWDRIPEEFKKLIAGLSKDQCKTVIQGATNKVKACMLLNEHVMHDTAMAVKCLKAYTSIRSKIFVGEDIYIPDAVINAMDAKTLLLLIEKAVSVKKKSHIRFNPDVALEKVLPALITNPDNLEMVKEKLATLRISNGEIIKEMMAEWAKGKRDKNPREVIRSILENEYLDNTAKSMLIEIYAAYNSVTISKIRNASIMEVEQEYGRLRDFFILSSEKGTETPVIDDTPEETHSEETYTEDVQIGSQDTTKTCHKKGGVACSQTMLF